MTIPEIRVVLEWLVRDSEQRGQSGRYADSVLTALREAAAILGAAQEVWDSVPATYDETDPVVKRHAAALNNLGALLRGEP
jgi:hypothetical protein